MLYCDCNNYLPLNLKNMIPVSTRVKRVFEKKLKDWHLEHTLSQMQIDAIMRAMQEAYDLGHADGFSEAVIVYNV